MPCVWGCFFNVFSDADALSPHPRPPGPCPLAGKHGQEPALQGQAILDRDRVRGMISRWVACWRSTLQREKETTITAGSCTMDSGDTPPCIPQGYGAGHAPCIPHHRVPLSLDTRMRGGWGGGSPAEVGSSSKWGWFFLSKEPAWGPGGSSEVSPTPIHTHAYPSRSMPPGPITCGYALAIAGGGS